MKQNKVDKVIWFNELDIYFKCKLCKKYLFKEYNDDLSYSDKQKIYDDCYNDNIAFNPKCWKHETSSGYYGYRNIITDEWIYKTDYDNRKGEYVENEVWKNEVFRIIKLHTKSNKLTEEIVNELKKEIKIFRK